MEKQVELLKKELSEGRNEIKTDNYHMSIGEVINMYKDGDIKLDPAFQRLFRWDNFQKTKFIESILLGIPIPPIFVSQQKDGKWTIVDGVQRLSTIFQFSGDLKEMNPLKLTEAPKLTYLTGLYWNDLSFDIHRIIKRSKIGINIILTENSIEAQYELFQRLNTGGSHLEAQEIRNCLIIMLDADFYNQLNDLKDYEDYKNCIKLTDNKLSIEHHMELILRYFITKNNKINFSNYSHSKDLLSDFIDRETTNLLSDKGFDIKKEILLFKKVFKYINSRLSNKIFRKYDSDEKDFKGSFIESSFESILPGLAKNFDVISSLSNDDFKNLIINMYNDERYIKATGRGVKAIKRIELLTKFSFEYFSEK